MKKMVSLMRSSVRPLNLEPYMMEMEEFYQKNIDNSTEPEEVKVDKIREFHDGLLQKYPQQIKIKCSSLGDLIHTIEQYGAIVSTIEDGQLCLYIAE